MVITRSTASVYCWTLAITPRSCGHMIVMYAVSRLDLIVLGHMSLDVCLVTLADDVSPLRVPECVCLRFLILICGF